MPTRKKHIKTEYESVRKEYREASPRHVVIFEADMDEDTKRRLFSAADSFRTAGNKLAGELQKNYGQLVRTKAYRKLQTDYGWHSERMKKLDSESGEYRKLEKESNAIGRKMSAMQKEYNITFEFARKWMENYTASHNLNSVFGLTRAEDVWSGMEKVLYAGASHLHYKKRGDLPILRAKQPDRSIIFKVGNDGNLYFSASDFGKFGLLPISGDLFLEEEYAAIMDFLMHPEMEETAVREYAKSRTLCPVFRPCYAALKCKKIRGKLRVFVHVTVAANPFPKKTKDGFPRHTYGTGRIGMDLGTQSCATVSDSRAELFNLAERNGHCTREHESRKQFLLKRMNQSRRKTNPWRFNKDGTYRKGSRGPWVRSQHYLKLEAELREIDRKDALSRKYAIREDVNRLRSQADTCIIEPPNAKKLQKRTKEVNPSGKAMTVTKKDGAVREIQKCKRKKRFGKSIQYRCPGSFQAEVRKKFGESHYHEVPAMYRASQYDHALDGYIKKKLSERWHILPDGKKVQRDLYSAFLLYCAGHNYQTIDRQKCLEMFDRFWDMHEKCICEIISNNLKICNSGIKKTA